jgi:hypothetical protein
VKWRILYPLNNAIGAMGTCIKNTLDFSFDISHISSMEVAEVQFSAHHPGGLQQDARCVFLNTPHLFIAY